MSQHNALILGPSKVGKTALVASLNHAARNLPPSLDQIDVQIQPTNNFARDLFAQVIKLLTTGNLPFSGTASIIDFEFVFRVLSPLRGFWGGIRKMFGKTHTKSASKITFMDAPGGAVFPGDDGEVDYAVMGEYRKRLINRLSTAQGLIICADSSEINAPESEDSAGTMRMTSQFSSWLDDICSRAAPLNSDAHIPLLPIKRVYVCMTKCDLWAFNDRKQSEAQMEVEALDPYLFCRDLLGIGFMKSLKTWLPDDAEVAFGFTSVFGFVDGGINVQLIEAIESEQAVGVEEMEAWKPYRVLDPFVFLVSGQSMHDNVRIVRANRLGFDLGSKQ